MTAKQSAPAIPNPVTTAAAQTTSNIDTAKASATLNNTNQVTPYGNLTYTSTTPAGSSVPQYTATQTLSDAGQKLLTTNQGTTQSLADTGAAAAGRLGGQLAAPLDLSAANLDKYTNSHYLDPFNKQSDRDQAALESKLAAQGIQIGTASYTNAMTDFNNQKSANLNNLQGSSQQNAQASILAQRETPINEISALTGGSQVTTPSYAQTPQTGVAGTDIAGITNGAYAAQSNAYNYANNQNQQLLGGLFGLGAAGIMHSDERLKDDIEPEGKLPDGTNVYSYDYKPGHGLPAGRQVGVIAQEIEKSNPSAVSKDAQGYRRVDYRKVMAKALMTRKAA
jgi:hypothetical protein